MNHKAAISMAISVLDVRADQWAAAANGPCATGNSIPELYEADEAECNNMETMCREAIKTLQEHRNDPINRK